MKKFKSLGENKSFCLLIYSEKIKNFISTTCMWAKTQKGLIQKLLIHIYFIGFNDTGSNNNASAILISLFLLPPLYFKLSLTEFVEITFCFIY